MIPTAPLVSVVIPAYKVRYLLTALRSALAQTYQPVEIVVSDDCPTDAVRGLCEAHRSIRYVRNPIPGVWGNFGHCMAQARGEFIKFLLDDDALEPNCISRMMKAIGDLGPGLGRSVNLVSSVFKVMDEWDRVTGTQELLQGSRDMLFRDGAAAGLMLKEATNFAGCLSAVLIRGAAVSDRDALRFFSRAPERYTGLNDLSLLLDLAFAGGVIYLREPLSLFRVSPDQLSNPWGNPNHLRSVTSWEPLARDAHAEGLISDEAFRISLASLAGKWRKMSRVHPVLEAGAARLEAEVASLIAEAEARPPKSG